MMIIYDLKCCLGHRFEGWFENANSFDKQQSSGLIHCSVCGKAQVEKVISGGHISLASTDKIPKHPSPVPTQEQAVNVDAVTLMKAVNHYVRTHFKDVGVQFAERALQMNRGQIPHDAIYGTATPQEFENLEEEEVPVTLLPKLPDEFDN